MPEPSDKICFNSGFLHQMKDKSGHKEKVVNGITVGGFGQLLGSEEQLGPPRSGKAAFLRRGEQG